MQTTSNGIIRGDERAPLHRVALVGVGALAGWVVLVAWCRLLVVPGLEALGGPGVAPMDVVLIAVIAACAAALAAWLLLGVTAAVLAQMPGRLGRAAAELGAQITPRAARRVVGVALGVGLATAALPGQAVGATHAGGVAAVSVAATDDGRWPDPGLVPSTPTATSSTPSPAPSTAPSTSASATSSPTPTRPASTTPASTTPASPSASPSVSADAGHHGSAPAPAPSSTPDPGWVPSTPTVRPQPSTRLLDRVAPERDDGVVVHRGDTLWSVAARHLGPGATDSEIADAWPRWYAANREVIGPDPDLILPGQILTPPTANGALR